MAQLTRAGPLGEGDLADEFRLGPVHVRLRQGAAVERGPLPCQAAERAPQTGQGRLVDPVPTLARVRRPAPS
jgi:hypothetical protein